MAQRRMVSRRLTESQKIHRLSGDARFVYVALLPYTDREGRLNANPVALKSTIFEPFEYTVSHIAEMLDELAGVGLVKLYGDERFPLVLEYVKFTEFNTPDKKEPKSDFPSSKSTNVRSESARRVFSEYSQKVLGISAEVSPLKGKEVKGKEEDLKSSSPPESPEVGAAPAGAPPPTSKRKGRLPPVAQRAMESGQRRTVEEEREAQAYTEAMGLPAMSQRPYIREYERGKRAAAYRRMERMEA